MGGAKKKVLTAQKRLNVLKDLEKSSISNVARKHKMKRYAVEQITKEIAVNEAFIRKIKKPKYKNKKNKEKKRNGQNNGNEENDNGEIQEYSDEWIQKRKEAVQTGFKYLERYKNDYPPCAQLLMEGLKLSMLDYAITNE